MSLLGIEFPKPRGLSNGSFARIEVAADSMRVGKTTAVKVISEGLRRSGLSVVDSYEDWESNPYLAKSYSDPEHNFLNSQKWFIKRKWEQIRDAGGAEVVIQDVAPETDFCYAATNMLLGRMSVEDFATYVYFYDQLDWSQAPAPNLTVYLAVSDEQLIQRALDSRREFETVEPEYFLMMKKVNRAWLDQAESKMNVLVVDTDTLNFATDSSSQEKLVEMVQERLR